MKSRQETIILVNYDKMEDLKSTVDGRYHYFYKIINTINNKYYYGIHTTDNIYDGYSGSGELLKLVYKKYGKENCIKYILKFFEDRKSLLQYEKEIINKDILEDSNCYNISLGGNGNYNTCTPVVTKDGKTISVSKEEYKRNKHLYKHPTSGKIHINNGIKNKLVLPKELNYWLKNGWLIGETNRSCAGKILVNRNELEERFIFKEELDQYISDGWVRGGKSRNKGQKSFAKDLFWITNGVKQKRIDEDLLNYYLSNGWWKGSPIKGMSGKSWINNGKDSIVISNNIIEEYISNGWVRGRLIDNKHALGKIAVNKDGITIMIKNEMLDKYLEDGWKKGSLKSANNKSCLNKIAINKDGEIKKINKDELDKYLKDGWEKGMGKSIMKGRIRINNRVCEKLVTLEEFETTYSKDGWIRGLLNKRK